MSDHDPRHDWTNTHRHPWAQGFDSSNYIVDEPYPLEHTHDGAKSALRQRQPQEPRERPVTPADPSGVPGQASDPENAGEGHQ